MTDATTLQEEYISLRPTFKTFRGLDGKNVYAAQATEKNIRNIQTHWTPNAPVRLGDYVILKGDGRLEVVDETHFGDTYDVPEGQVIALG